MGGRNWKIRTCSFSTVASHNSSDLKNCHIKAMTNTTGGLTCPPAVAEFRQALIARRLRSGIQSMKASARYRSASPPCASASRALGGKGARDLAWGRERQVASLRAGSGSSLPQPSCAAGSSQPCPASGSACRSDQAVPQGRPARRRPALRAGAGPPSGAVSPGGAAVNRGAVQQRHGADPRCTLGTAGPCRGNPVLQALPGPGAGDPLGDRIHKPRCR